MAEAKRFLFKVQVGSKLGPWVLGTTVDATAEGEEGKFLASVSIGKRFHKASETDQAVAFLKDAARRHLRDLVDAGRVGSPLDYLEEEDPNETP